MNKSGSTTKKAEKKEKRALSFYIEGAETDDLTQPTVGTFDTPRAMGWLRLNERLDAISANTKTYKTLFNKLDGMIQKEPDFLNAYNCAGDASLDLADGKQDNAVGFVIWVDSAWTYYNSAFERAKELIPADFKGQIPWSFLDNRPFLQAHNGLIQCKLRWQRYAEAAQMMDEHLAWNPNDNIGVRLIRGDTYILAGDLVKARMALQDGIQSDYPPSYYSLGLLEFQAGNFTAAATALRLGFVENMYIAEILTGREAAKNHFFWHGSSWSSVREAKCYLKGPLGMLSYWQSVGQAVDFVDWLYNCAAVMKERLEMAEIREGLTYKKDFTSRGPFVERERTLKEQISKVSMLIQKVPNNRGCKRWPWEPSPEASFLE